MTERRLNWICAVLALALAALSGLLGSFSGLAIFLLGALFWACCTTTSPVNGPLVKSPIKWIARRLSRLARFG